jgi:hypothetical protein
MGQSVLDLEMESSTKGVENSIPTMAQNLTGYQPSESGSNCFNAALIWYGFTTEVKFTDPEDLMEITQRYFQKLEPNSKKQFGDLLIIKDKTGSQFWHAAILIDNQTVWHKRGPGIEYPWNYQSLETMLQPYFTAPGCYGYLVVEFYRRKSLLN